jgi:hypothetical protein
MQGTVGTFTAWRIAARALVSTVLPTMALLLFAPALFAAVCVSAGTGNWGTAATWSSCGGIVPKDGDSVTIQTGHTVTLNVNSAKLDGITVETGGVLRGDGTGKILTGGKLAGNDVVNNGTINFTGANLASIKLDKDSIWNGSTTSVWNLSTVDVNGKKLNFTAGASFTVNLSGAGDPFSNEDAGVNAVSNPDITFNYNGTAAQTLSNQVIGGKKGGGPAVIIGNLNVNNTAGVSLTVNLDATNLLGSVNVVSGVLKDAGFSLTGQAAKTFTVSNGATFEITNSTGMVTGFGTRTFQPTSTVDYRLNGNQPVSLETYGHVRLSVGGTKTPPAGTNIVAGDFTVGAGATYAGNTNNTSVNIGGSLSNSGTFNVGTGTYTFNGAGVQTLTGVSSFTNLAIANTGTTAGAGLTLTANTTVTTTSAGTLTFTSGVINTGSFSVIVARSCTAALSRTSGHVAGNLQLRFPTGSNIACTFPVGDAFTSGRYTPVAITFASVGTAGDLTGRTTAGDHPDIVNSTIDDLRSVNRFWTLTNTSVVFTSYGAAFTYVAADNDGSATPGNYIVAKGDGCSGAETGCTWTEQTVSGTPTNTSITATGMTGFSRFIVGERRNQLANFLIDVGAGTGSTCAAKAITITARRANGTTLTTYAGSVSITTSTNHGDWSRTPTGNLVNGTADDGAAVYTFTGGGGGTDNGVLVLNLTNTHADDLTITVTDSVAVISSISATVSFRDNAFEISGSSVVVAGRGETYSVTAVRKDPGTGVCGTATGYAGSKNLKSWIARTPGVNGDPGGTAPTIGALSLPNALPGANNLTLNFAAGIASFVLDTTDVGKYAINITDVSRTFAGAVDITGSSSTLTVRPFGFTVTAKKGALANPGGTAMAGAKFIAAADTFEATVTARRWQSVDDSNSDGIPDSGADLSDNATTASYAFATALSLTAGFTPSGGSAGTLTGTTTIPAVSFSAGIGTVADLAYDEAGSIILAANATAYLGTAGADVGGLSTAIGRFYPDHFADVSAPSVVNGACLSGGFTYMEQGGIDLKFKLQARNKNGIRTQKYRSADYATGAVPIVAENNNDGVNRDTRLSSVPSATWVAGEYEITSSSISFSRGASPDGPFDLLDFGVYVIDADAAVLATLDMNPGTTGNCVTATNCTAKKIGSATKVRFGRLRLNNAFGSSLLDLPLPLVTQYYDGSFFVTNTADSCTALVASDIAFSFVGPNLAACETHLNPAGAVAFNSGIASLKLTKPGSNKNGGVDLTVNLGASASGTTCTSVTTGVSATTANKSWLRGNWGTGTYTDNPRGRATFGTFKNADQFLHFRELY